MPEIKLFGKTVKYNKKAGIFHYLYEPIFSKLNINMVLENSKRFSKQETIQRAKNFKEEIEI